MEASLLSLVSECISRALALGLTSTNQIALHVGINDANSVTIYVSHREPTGTELPFNYMWIMSDPTHINYRKIYKRTSRNPSGGWTNTYVAMTVYNDVMTNVASYDNPAGFIRLAPQSHSYLRGNVHGATPNQIGAVNINGDQMLGALLARPNWIDTALQSNELIPLQKMIDDMNGQTQGFYSLMQSLLRRIMRAEQTIVNHEQRILALENYQQEHDFDPLLIPRTYVHVQEEPSATWIVHHQLGNTDLIAQYWVAATDGEGNPILQVAFADDMTVIDGEFVIVTHSMPVSGKVVLLEAKIEGGSLP